MPTRPDGGNYSRSGSTPRRTTTSSRSTNSMDRRAEAEYQQRVKGRTTRVNQEKSYLQQLQDLIYGSGMQQGGGGGGSSRRGGGGGGGYGGPSAYEKWQIAQEEKRQKELERRKAELTAGLQGARRQAIPLLNRYASEYGGSINKTFAENRGLNAGYADQLKAIQNQMNQGMQGQQQMLQRDLQGQGANSEVAAMQAAAQQGMAGTDFLSMLGQQYNTRLAQAMAAAQADAGSMGSAIKASSLGNLENSYANLLAQIGMMGLQ